IGAVVGKSVSATFPTLLPCVLADEAIHAAHDDLSVLPTLLRALLAQADVDLSALPQASYAYLAGHGLLADPHAAVRASERALEFVGQLVDDLAAHGGEVGEGDGGAGLFAGRPSWDELAEQSAAARARTYLPPAVRVEFPGHYQALYARAPRSAIMLAEDGSVTLVGSTFRPGRLERFGEAF